MDNSGKFHSGTVFLGNVNGVKMVVLKIQKDSSKGCNKEIAVIKDIATGKTFHYGLRALERCNVTILERKNDIMDACAERHKYQRNKGEKLLYKSRVSG